MLTGKQGSAPMVRVHQTKSWDIQSGDWVVHPLKSTEERIKAWNELVAIPGTAEDVDSAMVDDDGHYIPHGSHPSTTDA
jgi:hypothetical protein